MCKDIVKTIMIYTILTFLSSLISQFEFKLTKVGEIVFYISIKNVIFTMSFIDSKFEHVIRNEITVYNSHKATFKIVFVINKFSKI